ncbi:MAG: methyltransferase family protein [Promethearchaeota archaeon]
MNSKKPGHEREIPHAHLYHVLLPIIFMVIWILDTNIFRISTILDNYFPFILRLIFFIVILIIAFSFIQISHKTLFKSHEPPTTLIDEGILGRTRNPMYFGILLIYVACIFLSISLISIGIFLLIFLIYNKMAIFEEKILEEKFGNEFRDYKKRVSRWFPKITKK